MAEKNYRNTFEVLGDRAPKICEPGVADGFAIGFETPDADPQFYSYQHPDLLPHEMRIRVTKSGMCATDMLKARMQWGAGSAYPLVPGHEIIGHITEMGDDVKGFDLDQRVGFGFFNSSCKTCEFCLEGRNDNCASKTSNIDPYWGGWRTSY
jgi:D-arabinose 1-dehydrogenase-like Zn-dependent alcohol dehydrogenase